MITVSMPLEKLDKARDLARAHKEYVHQLEVEYIDPLIKTPTVRSSGSISGKLIGYLPHCARSNINTLSALPVASSCDQPR